MFQVARAPQVFDVVVIGSGAGGGTAVKVLTDAGIRVALLEAGPMLTPEKDFKEHVWPYQVDHRGAGPHAECYFGRQQWGYFNAPNGYWDVPGEPYTVAPGRTSGAGSARAFWAAAPTTTAAFRCAFPITISSPKTAWAIRLARHLRRDLALLRQGRRLHRRHRHARKDCAPRPTAISCRPSRRAFTKCWCRRRAAS